jgi:hypothetical protein
MLFSCADNMGDGIDIFLLSGYVTFNELGIILTDFRLLHVQIVASQRGEKKQLVKFDNIKFELKKWQFVVLSYQSSLFGQSELK